MGRKTLKIGREHCHCDLKFEVEDIAGRIRKQQKKLFELRVEHLKVSRRSWRFVERRDIEMRQEAVCDPSAPAITCQFWVGSLVVLYILPGRSF